MILLQYGKSELFRKTKYDVDIVHTTTPHEDLAGSGYAKRKKYSFYSDLQDYYFVPLN